MTNNHDLQPFPFVLSDGKTYHLYSMSTPIDHEDIQDEKDADDDTVPTYAAIAQAVMEGQVEIGDFDLEAYRVEVAG
ncbi:hypothetical protein IHN63_00090 [Deinococcus sp. 6YEL10]|uniref:hypothetical protein n=1 Tax=Deinococcus sp. 6YEL10 TaxID=2745870 RepID=UPI001E4B74C6|nr:hypothetical protein [Deinococcus sp. 6YEL10]MCD0159697.1 hypothetical protein [Deinococcus sp. 6YEL10]